MKNNLHVIEYYNITIFAPPKLGNCSLNVTGKTVLNTDFLTAANVHPVHRLIFINNIHLMCAPEGNSEFCFPESLNVSRDEVKGNIETRGKTKLTISRRSTYYVLCYIARKEKSTILIRLIVFHDIMTINRKFYSVNEIFASSK